ncbi:protein NRT1/ PTR FAMILY 4.5-like isoform X2 [Asparagus officinalis]|uniref:protein NRT1/ PTR FAMILY 4.5-like isoform X2 n=1 Tax=Asparagus officinalis TaxID=4686 RepID=UPI00098E2944|nr:protein NRT1/ PTR FAMILY 4.5-like isoform X2 [Asparagus officinalis]
METQGIVDWRGNPIDKKKHGGVRAAFFTQFMETMTTIGYIPSSFNLVTYLHDIMHTGVAKSSTMSTNFTGITCAFALLGAFLSDSYTTRFKTMLIFGPFQFVGYGLLALQARHPSLHPPHCNTSDQLNDCQRVHGFNLVLLYIGLYTIALGEGCMRACLAPFGGDQFDSQDPEESQLQSSFFNWFTFSIGVGGFIGLIFIVWLENNKGWDYSFGVSALLFLIGLLVLASGFPLYRNQKSEGSPLTRILQVFVSAFNKRNLTMPETLEDLKLDEKEQTLHMEKISHTKGLRFLDKACIDDGKSGRWSLCTVTQVEETKILFRMVPIFLTSVLTYTPTFLLLTFTVQQGNTMNTKVGKIHISPVSLFLIPIVLQTVILVVYDRFFVPFARRMTGYSSGITYFQRIGIGFVVITIATGIAAIIERKRLKIVEENGLEDLGTGVPMSVLWLSAQFLFLGITDATAFPGLLEFFNSEASRGMKSLGTAIFWCTLGLSSLMGTLLIDIVNKVTRHSAEGKGWLEGDTLNQSRVDLFYWLLFAHGGVTFLIYLYFAKRYVYRCDPRINNAGNTNLIVVL